ncbi:MAG: phosphotransferase [bacterium]|nr:phosphotransferase [bacterium]
MMKKYLETQLDRPGSIISIKKIRGEASTRSFFRVQFKKYSLIAMVYPEEKDVEIQRIVHLTALYSDHRLNVPEIKETIGGRIILMEDLGDLLVQKAFSRSRAMAKQSMTAKIAEILVILSKIPLHSTAAVLDTARMKWEMDFFVTHFARNFCNPSIDFQELTHTLHRMVEAAGPINTFAHRDFHSRNMLLHKEKIYLVDFQDSLVAPACYDLVSFAFDAYLDLKTLRESFLLYCRTLGLEIDEEQYFLTALQRNIKALGTFGFQVTQRKNLSYKRYVDRTIRHVLNNPLYGKYLDASGGQGLF